MVSAADRRRTIRAALLAAAASILMIAGCSDALVDGLSSVSHDATERAQPMRISGESRLRLLHLHTGESVDVAYRIDGRAAPGGIRMLNHLLRDWRTGQDAHYPLEEFDLLHRLLEKLNKRGALIQIVCGYRSPATNRLLRAGSPATGVAENSQHVLSQAIDLRVPGVSTKRLRDAALSLGMGGVGYYPRSGFVHVDVGPVRHWSFGASLRTRHHASSKHEASRKHHAA